MKTREKIMLCLLRPFVLIAHGFKKIGKTTGNQAKPAMAMLVAVAMLLSAMPMTAFAVETGEIKIDDQVYDSLDAAFAAVKANEEIKVSAGSYTLDNSSDTLPDNVTIRGEEGATIATKLSITANGVKVQNIDIVVSGDTALQIKGNGSFEGCTISGVNGARNCYANNGDVTFKDCVITGSTYGVHFGGGSGEGNVIIDNCQISGWTSFATTIEKVVITNTEFVDGNYNMLRFYQNAEVTECTFPTDGGYEDFQGGGMRIDTGSGGTGMEGITVTFTDCDEEVKAMLPGNVTDLTSVVIDEEPYVAPVAKNGETEYSSLNDAIAQGGTVVLLRDATVGAVTVPAGLTVTIDLNTYTLNGYIYTENECDLTVTNGEIVNTNTGYSGIEVQKGKLTLTNVDITSARHAVRIDGAVTGTISGGIYTVSGSSGMTTHVLNISGAANVTINGGTFIGPKGTEADSGAAVNVQTGATVKIEGGSFSGGMNNTLDAEGDLNVSAGTFDQAVEQEYCADGLEPKQNADGTYGVEVAASSSLSGEGTEDSPYIINNLADLKYFRNQVNSGNTYEGKFVKLASSIDLEGVEWASIGNGVRSGSSYTGNAFKGTFDGNNCTIFNLAITKGETVGLFGIVDSGTVKNLILDETAINAQNGDNVGAAIGVMVNNATADSITVYGKVSGDDGVGGVVGRMIIDGTISNCVNHAEVKAVNTAGGIVGKAYYTAADKEMNISDCANKADVTGGYAAGGIVGLSAANVTGCNNTGNITAGTEAGGIVGEQVNYGEVSGNTNSGKISNNGTGGSSYGGIIGWIRYQDNTSYDNSEVIAVSGNENTGTISAAGANLGAGGIVGSIYNQASVTGNTNSSESIVGGVFAAGIVGNLQTNSDNKELDNAIITVTGNTTNTPLDAIDGDCKDYVAYNNVPNLFVVIDNYYGAAIVDGIGYPTLADAFNAAKKGSTITLLEDITLTEKITITDNGVLSNITLNGNNKTITVKGHITGISFGSTSTSSWATGVKINNLTVHGEGAYMGIALIGGTSSTLTNVKVTGEFDYGINFYGTHGATLDNCQIVNGFTNGQPANPLNLTNGTVIGSLIANDSSNPAAGAKIFVDETSSITTLYADDHTKMIDPNSLDRIGSILEADTKESMVAEINGVQYQSLALAIENAKSGDTIKLIRDDLALSETVTIPADKTLTLDLNGKTITGTDPSTSGNWQLIENKGSLTIKDSVGTGKITLTATTDRDFNAYSAVIGNFGTLTVESGTIKHLGGTDMAYAIDSNSTSSSVSVTVKGGTIASTYRGIRQFANNTTKENNLVITGGIVSGDNRAVWMQSTNVKANKASLTINGTADVGSVYMWSPEGGDVSSLTLEANAANVENVVDGLSSTDHCVFLTNGVYRITERVDVTGVTLDKTSESLTVGDSVTLIATVAPSDATINAVTWTSSDESVATVDSNGKVTAVAAGTVTITVKAGDKTASCTLTVTAKHTEHTYECIVKPEAKKSDADCTHPAVYYKSCSVCGHIGTETFTSGEAKGHSYENGKCTVCGAADPDYKEPAGSPQTGEGSNLMLWFALLFVSGGVVVVLAVYGRKRRNAVK